MPLRALGFKPDPIVLWALLALLPLSLVAPPTRASGIAHIVGSYDDSHLASIESFTLPRVFLYDSAGALIPQDSWPAELREFREHAGDAFCCVSDKPAPTGSTGPPPDCRIIYYGTDVQANFSGLHTSTDDDVSYEKLPPHQYLLVEYYASWCQPCVAGRKILEAFVASGSAANYLWVSIDMSRLAEIQKPQSSANH